jgi:hypothetical protein
MARFGDRFRVFQIGFSVQRPGLRAACRTC